MISRTWIWTTAAYLFATMAMPVSTAAQDATTQDHKSKHSQYKLIDLGTLGGPQSFLGASRRVNSKGAVIPGMDTSAPDPFFPNGLGEDGYVKHAAKWQRQHATDLGALPGGSSAPNWVSDSGLVAGTSENAVIDPDLGVVEFRAVYWGGNQIHDLGTLGGNESLSFAVNNQGTVVGCATNTVSDPYFFFCGGATQSRAFRYSNGRMRDLGTLGGTDATSLFVNERGQIVGISFTNNTSNASTGLPTIDPFLWDNGNMIDLGGLGGAWGEAEWLNNRGQVVGWSDLPGDTTNHPFLWDRGVMRDLGTLGGDWGLATSIHDNGDVVGVASLPPGGAHDHDAFLWRHGVMTDLGNLGNTSWGYAVNSRTQVVGASSIDATTAGAFLWENGGPIVDLNGLVENSSGAQLVYAFSINDSGQIAVYGFLPSGDWHAFTLIPDGDCDEHDYEARLRVNRENLASLTRVTGIPGRAITSDAPTRRGIAGLSPSSLRRSTIQDRHAMPMK